MNRRKSLSKKQNKKLLFTNTDDFRTGNGIRNNSLGGGAALDSGKQNSPLNLNISGGNCIEKSNECTNLIIQRKRRKSIQLNSFSNKKEKVRKDVKSISTGGSELVLTQTEHKEADGDNNKISESDLLLSETLLKNDEDSDFHFKESSKDSLLEISLESKKPKKGINNRGFREILTPIRNCTKEYVVNEDCGVSHQVVESTPFKIFDNCDDSLANLLSNTNPLTLLKTPVEKEKFLSMVSKLNDNSMFADLELTCLIKESQDDSLNGNLQNCDAFYGLPVKAKEMFIKHRNISKLYDWQDECLKLSAIEKRMNLIYSLPTSGGKTLVAEILMLKELLVREKNALLVLPYVAIVQEKVRGLSPFAVDLGFHVEEYAGGKGAIPPKKRRVKKTIYIATIEKANAIVNSLIELERSDELGMLVVDELHMVGDGGERGSLLEILLTKVMFKCKSTQAIGMSATLGNMDEIKRFLNAEVYTNDFRPVELTEYLKLENNIYRIDLNAKSDEEVLIFERKVSHPGGLSRALASRDPDHILSLVLEVIPENSCLMFCATKKNCENAAMMLARSLPKQQLEVKKHERDILLKSIQQAISGVCDVLSKTIPYGISYHHSGLTSDERELIEEAYSSGVLCLLCCTSTLAAGVNLPARRVILRSPYIGIKFLTQSRYKQIVGRAGRAGIDTHGESILVMQNKDKARVLSLISGSIPNCTSSLFYEDGKGLRQLILSLLGLKICSSEKEIEDFFERTLYHIQKRNDENYQVLKCIKKEVNRLLNLGLLTNNMNTSGVSILRATDLGKATLKGCVNIDLAPYVYEQLKKGLEAICLVNELHLLYLVTPFDSIETLHVDWMLFYNCVDKFREVELKACEFVGISQNILCKKATGQRVPKGNFNEFIYKRFYLTLIIQEILMSKSLMNVAQVFNQTRGFLQNLLSSTFAFMSLMINFTEELSDLWALKLLFQALLARVTFIRNVELIALMEIPGVKQARASQLFKAGYQTIQHLAHADSKTLVKDIERLSTRQANLIVSSAKMILKEKIDSLREEADEIAAIPDS